MKFLLLWICVFNTHWDHRHQESRERAAMLISKRIDGRKHADEPVALIGDFNSVESNPGMVSDHFPVTARVKFPPTR